MLLYVVCARLQCWGRKRKVIYIYIYMNARFPSQQSSYPCENSANSKLRFLQLVIKILNLPYGTVYIYLYPMFL